MKRKYAVTIYVENDSETLAEGLKNARQLVKFLGLNVVDCKPVKSQRSLAQNNALHLWFTQLSQELLDHGLDMKAILKDGFEFTPTPFALKEYIWKPCQRSMFGKKSTTQLDKTEEINAIVKVITRALHERTKGMIIVPPFPSIDTIIDNYTTSYPQC